MKKNLIKNLLKNLLKNISILDLGCGGGLISEPLARLGANVTGIDFISQNINYCKKTCRRPQI